VPPAEKGTLTHGRFYSLVVLAFKFIPQQAVPRQAQAASGVGRACLMNANRHYELQPMSSCSSHSPLRTSSLLSSPLCV
jgi:hypothetical protein